jgi:hypothetical protein
MRQVVAAILAFAACGGQGRAPASANLSIVHGVDDRIEVFQSDPAAPWARASRAVAVLLAESSLRPASDPSFTKVVSKDLRHAEGLCPGQRFATQPAAGECTAFLVAPRLVFTAGHCVFVNSSLDKVRVVFGYAVDAKTRDPRQVRTSDVYRVSSVAAFIDDDKAQVDFAALWLDREVSGRVPLEIATDVHLGDALTLIGHPSGIPAKVASGGRVSRFASRSLFQSSVDAFKGNSGSPLFSDRTAHVVGILVRGGPLQFDYATPRGASCQVVNSCRVGLSGCTGEEAVHARVFAPFVPRPPPDGLATIEVVQKGPVALPASGTIRVSLDVADEATIEDVSLHLIAPDLASEQVSAALVHPDGTTAALHIPVLWYITAIDMTFGELAQISPELRRFRGRPAVGRWQLVITSRDQTKAHVVAGATLTLQVSTDPGPAEDLGSHNHLARRSGEPTRIKFPSGSQ